MNRSSTHVATSLAAFSLSLWAGCSSSNNAGPSVTDAGSPDAASSSGGSSSGSSSGSSGGADASIDATVEAGPDAAGPIGIPDASVDAVAQAGPDSGSVGIDASAGDASEGGPEEGGTVAITGSTQMITLADGVGLYIGDSHAVWSYDAAPLVTYQNLPAALIGTVGNDTVNTSTSVTFTLSATTTCYLLRQNQWTAVDLTGWVPYATAAYYFAGYDDGSYGTATIYTQTFPAGVYNWSTFSAMYSCAE